ncbi:ABC transporter family substrate-binding protein [Sediminivirga luteola]|uniref:ABC transporter family substrate-binding protein n=1 Tax=Sediminivirga luteola TaxID=1774748 RepID=UPI001F5A40ED|nr:ABC transporter family substrate-binding protein [Sediminivirga luteola]MCI2265718.1 ABC transporter family substrate-binding protein [Sediminivirga luteola]
MALLLSACTAPGGDEENGGDGGAGSVLNVGWNEPFRSLNTETANGNAVANAIVTYLLNDNFVYYDDELELQQGELGTVEQVSEDPLQVRYTFADDATWSDGTPVDAADIVLTWAAKSTNYNTGEGNRTDDGEIQENEGGEVYFDSASPGSALIQEFPEISEDRKEVTFTYSEPFADWQIELGLGADGVGVPAHIVAKKALGEEDPEAAKQAVLDAIENEDTEALSEISNVWNTGFDFTSMPDDEDLLVHNGPYQLADFQEGQYLTLTKSEEYSGPRAGNIDTITYRYNEDPMAMVQAIENGEVDLTQPQATADVLAAAEAIDGVNVDTDDGATYEHIDLTFDNNGPFDPASYDGDEETALQVRQAFLKTIPRQQIVDTIIDPLNPGAVVRDSFTQVPGSPWYDEIVANNGADEYAEVDIEGAQALLEDAGVEAPEVRFLYGASNQRRAQQFQLVKESAEQAGFVIIEDADDNWGTRLGDGTYDASLFGWQSTNTGVTEPDANYRTGQQNNYGGYSNEEVDDILTELQTELDEGRQLELSIELESHLHADAFGVNIFQHPELLIYRDRVQNVSSTAVSPTMFWNFWEWEVS